MKRLFVAACMALASCKGETGAAPGTDTVVTAQAGTEARQHDRIFYGTWEAHIGRSAQQPARPALVVSGAIDPEKPGATVVLIKPGEKKQPGPGALLLYLSKRPRKTLREPVRVTYTEDLDSAGTYSRIYIMYRYDTVAVISDIDSAQKK